MTEKRFTYLNASRNKFIGSFFCNGNPLTNEEVVDELNALHKEKEFWKSNACNQSSFNSILLNELDIAREQGYEVSDPFKKLMEDKND